jgi:hypothetical protein
MNSPSQLTTTFSHINLVIAFKEMPIIKGFEHGCH